MASLLRKRLVFTNEHEIWESGTIVWSLFSNQWWPSMIISLSKHTVYDRRMYVVFWFGDDKISKVFADNIIPFVANYKIVYNSILISRPWLTAVEMTLREFLDRNSIEPKELHKWAYTNLLNLPPRDNAIPLWIENVLHVNSESFKNLSNITVEQFLAYNRPRKNINRRQLSLRQQDTLNAAKNKENGLYGYCLSCYSFDVEQEHPFFVGHMCIPCLDDLKSVIMFERKFGHTDYCCVCADNINTFVTCSNTECMKSFCKKCIYNLCGDGIRKNVVNIEIFVCLLCTNAPNKNISGILLTPRFDFKSKVDDLIDDDVHVLVDRPVLREPLTVISINDTSQIGLKALKELGIPVQVYYVLNSFSNASYEEVQDLGYLCDVTASSLKNFGPVHLIIMGSPSNCNFKMQIGDLHQLFRFINLVKTFCSKKFFWFFEKPASIDINTKIMVDRFLQCKPVKLNSSEERLFWGNLPTLSDDKYTYFRTSCGFRKRSSNAVTNENDQEEEKLFLMRGEWNLEFLKKLLGFLSDFYDN